MKKLTVIAGLFLAIFITTANQAYSETICGCSGKFSGRFRIVSDVNQCRWWENKVTFETGAGEQGPQGEIGPQGPVGLQGEIGIQGTQGPIGPKGIQGVAGPQGSQGEPGVCGITREEFDSLNAKVNAIEDMINPCVDSVFYGDFFITSQDEIDYLKGYTELYGDMMVYGHGVTSLEGLECLKNIRGSVEIVDTNIDSLDGLKNLTNMNGYLWISRNPELCNQIALDFGKNIVGGAHITIQNNKDCN